MIKQFFQRALRRAFPRANRRLQAGQFSKPEALPLRPLCLDPTHARTLSTNKDFKKKDFRKKDSASHRPFTTDPHQLDQLIYTLPRADIVAALNRTLQHSSQDFPPRDCLNSYADHPDQVCALADSAYLCDRQGRHAEAERLYKQVIFLRERRYGDRHLCVADSLSELASLYRSQKRYSEAQPLLQRSLSIRYELMVASHLEIADNLYQLADTFYQQLFYSKAEPLYQQALIIFRQQLGARHPHTQAAYNDLMRMLAAAIESGKFEDLTADLPPLDLSLDFKGEGDRHNREKPHW